MSRKSLGYPGLVIGGPLDGQLVDRAQPYFEIIVPDVTRPIYSSPQVPSTPADNVIRYKHHSTPHAINFWLPEGATLADALTILAVNYMTGVS